MRKSGTFGFSSSLFYSIFSLSFCFFCVLLCLSLLFINHVMLERSRRISSFLLPLFFISSLPLHSFMYLFYFTCLIFLFWLCSPPPPPLSSQSSSLSFFTSPLVFFLFTLSKSNRLSLFLIESLPSSSETHSSSQTDRGTEVRHTNTV